MNNRFSLSGTLAPLALCLFALPTPAAVQDSDARLSQAATVIDRALATSTMPGLVVGITDRKELRKVIVHGFADLKTHEPLTADSRLGIGSISKAFTAIALMQLAQEGRFDPQAPIKTYLPSFAVNSPFPPITGHHLMSHTAGLPDYLVDASSSRYVVAELRDFAPSYAPGAHWWYSNTGYQVLGYVLENIEGAPYHTIIQRRVLERLGMTSTAAIIDDSERSRMAVSYERWPYDGKYVEQPWFEYAAGDGSIVSNVSDMSAYVRFILNRGVGAHGRVLSEASFAKLTTPVLENYAYGLLVHHQDGVTVIHHSGGIAGFHSEIQAHMEDGFGLVFLSNGGIDPVLRKWIVAAVTAAYHGTALPDLPAPGRDPYATRPEEYVGVYHLGGGTNSTVEFIAAGGHLALKQGDRSIPLERMGADMFRTPNAEPDSFPYFFGRATEGPDPGVIEVSHGLQWYARDGHPVAPGPALPKEYAAFVGHFQNNGPEGPLARVFVRNGRLVMLFSEDEEPVARVLEPISPGVFRLEEPDYNPERARFDTVTDGHALRLTLSGVPLYRKDTP